MAGRKLETEAGEEARDRSSFNAGIRGTSELSYKNRSLE